MEPTSGTTKGLTIIWTLVDMCDDFPSKNTQKPILRTNIVKSNQESRCFQKNSGKTANLLKNSKQNRNFVVKNYIWRYLI